MNPDEIKRLHRGALNLSHKGVPESDIGAWLAANSQGQYGSFADIKQAAATLPDNLLRGASALAQKGIPASDIDAWVAANTNGAIPTVQALSQQIGAERQVQNARDNPPNALEKIGQAGTGLGANYVQGATANFGDELAGLGATAASHPIDFAKAIGAVGSGPLAAGLAGPGAVFSSPVLSQDYRATQQQSQGQAEDYARQHPLMAGAAQTAGMLTGAVTAGLLGQPEVAAGYFPTLAKTIAGATAYGQIGGAGEAPTLKDVVPYAAAGGTNAGLTALAAGTLLPALAIGGSSTANLFRRLGNNPATLRTLADASVGGALAQDAANGGGLPAIQEMRAVGAPLVMGADAGGVSASLVRRAANLNPSLRSPIEKIIDARQSGRIPALMRNIEQGAGMTQAEARAGEAQAAAATSKAGELFNPLNPIPIEPSSNITDMIARLSGIDASMPAENRTILEHIKRMQTMTPAERAARSAAISAGADPLAPVIASKFGGPEVARIVNGTLRQVGREPLTVEHVRAIISDLGDAAAAASVPGTKNTKVSQSLWSAHNALKAALNEAVPAVGEANKAYSQAKTAEEAFALGVGARTAGDATQSMADRYAAIQAGSPETALRYKQGMLADLLRSLGQSHPATPGPAVKQVSAFADATRQAAGEPHAMRDLYRPNFPTREGLNLVDRGVHAANAQNYVDNVLHSGSTTTGQLGDLGNDYAVRSAKDIASPSWERMMSSLVRDAIDKMTAPGTRKAASMAANTLLQPATPEVQNDLYRLLQGGLLSRTERRVVGGLLLRGSGLFGAMAGQDTGRP